MNLRKQAPFSAPCGVPLPNKSPTQSPDISQSVSYFTVPPRAHPRHTGSQSRARHSRSEPGTTKYRMRAMLAGFTQNPLTRDIEDEARTAGTVSVTEPS